MTCLLYLTSAVLHVWVTELMPALSSCHSLEDTLKDKEKWSFYEHAHPETEATKPHIFLLFLSLGKVVCSQISDWNSEELIVQGVKCHMYVKVWRERWYLMLWTDTIAEKSQNEKACQPSLFLVVWSNQRHYPFTQILLLCFSSDLWHCHHCGYTVQWQMH